MTFGSSLPCGSPTSAHTATATAGIELECGVPLPPRQLPRFARRDNARDCPRDREDGECIFCGIFRRQVLNPELCTVGRTSSRPVRYRCSEDRLRDRKVGICIFSSIFRRQAHGHCAMRGRAYKVVTGTVQHMEPVSLMRRG